MMVMLYRGHQLLRQTPAFQQPGAHFAVVKAEHILLPLDHRNARHPGDLREPRVFGPFGQSEHNLAPHRAGVRP